MPTILGWFNWHELLGDPADAWVLRGSGGVGDRALGHRRLRCG